MYTENQLHAHADLLVEKVFQTETRWPHFRLLLRNIRDWARRLPSGATVVSLERTMLYGGISLVAPFFFRQKFISIDSSPESSEERGAYNAAMVDDARCIRVPLTCRAPIERTGLEAATADLVLVPNLVHHVADQNALFAEMARITRPGGFVYVFEPTLRELHQAPDDYLRYTPYGMRNALARAGLEAGEFEVEGGPFSAVAYCWTQALQYFPEPERTRMERWFYGEHFAELIAWDERYRKNLVRAHTSFPVSFSIAARKPAG